MNCRDCDRVLEDQGNRLKRAEEERRRLALAMESIAESLGVDAGRLAEDPWAVAESALQKAVAAEREACATMLKEKAESYRAQVATAPTAHYRSLVSGQAYVLEIEAERISARGQEPKT